MASKLDKIKSDFVEAMNASQRKTSAYDTEAEVVRIEGNTAWVHIAGGVTETPVQLTINAQKGDKVQVRVSNEGAWLMGNATAPPTDDTKANEADAKAVEAKYIAVDAASAAVKADAAAQDAVTSAETARTAAQIAQETAENVEVIAEQAQSDADSANASATSALINLGLIENVIDTLNWVQQHGYYQLTEDTAVVPNKVYYAITGTAITNPTGNPSLNIYYERSGSGTEQDPYTYTLSSDTTVDSSKTYYTVTAVSIAEPAENPSENGYYELIFNSALSQYVSTHLSLTNAGLSLLNDNSSGSMLLSTNGVTIKNARGTIVGQYGEGATIGNIDSQHISIINGQINFWAGTESNQTNLVAYVSNQELHIPRVVVIQSMQMGNWRWDASIEDHLSLNWIGG